MPRKHLVASATNKKQQTNASLWQKLAREIKAAAKVGGPNPDANPRLRLAIERALDNNLSRESIEKNIGAIKTEQDLEEMEFEAFGPNGVAIVIHALSDNVNRVAGNIRGYLTKLGTVLAKPGAAKSVFSQKGVILVAKSELSEDKILTSLADVAIEDVQPAGECWQITCAPNDFFAVKEAVAAIAPILEANVTLSPITEVEISAEQDNERLAAFIARCDADPDISWVVTNAV